MTVQTSARTRRKGSRTGAPDGKTPSWFIDIEDFLRKEEELLRRRLIPRPFDCDPCGHLEAPVSRLIRSRGGVVYTEKENGLAQSWARRVVYCNPPFRSEHMGGWGSKIRNELRRVHGMTFHGPAWTDRKWWHVLIEPDRRTHRCEVDFEEGRLGYGWPGNPYGVGGDTALFPSCWATWRLHR